MIPLEKITGRLGNKLFQFAYIYSQFKEGNIPDFYLQSPKYFEKYEKEIKEMFSEGIGYLDYVSIHVRIGKNPINPDEPAYSDNPFYVNLLKTDYYEKAIAMFPNDNFLVFTDDPEILKTLDLFKGERFQIMDKGGEIEDFNLMSSCKSHIIANSSYSFWSAFLSPNLGKTVVAPSVKNWYSDGTERTVCPKIWIRI